MDVSAGQIRAGRALAGWSQEDLSKASGVSRRVIVQVESGNGRATDRTIADLARALEDVGIRFFGDDEHGGRGVMWARYVPA